MSYFSDHYKDITYPVGKDGEPGLHNAQIGAIHAIASHFTLNKEPAIITLPTGSGKTAVLMMYCYLASAERVLILTPGKMLRDQIFDDFKELATLKEIGVLSEMIQPPRVVEIKSKIDSKEKWDALKQYDVVISTPNCVSPEYADIPKPPRGLFDLVLVDEAHHSPARTWNRVLRSFPKAKRVLFTATPFRRDRREIIGKFVYSYPVLQSYKDGIFGKIRFVPVNENDEQINNDHAIAKKAEEVLKKDREKGLDHLLIIRTQTKKRADDLAELYAKHTKLKLDVVHSNHSGRKVKKIIEQLRNKELDGVVCVNMLGEGFNLPQLKVAAIHTPHKSLEVTLQFIGRFARTNAANIGEAKFLAVPSEMEIEGEKLFHEGTVWQEAIIGLSHFRLQEEQETREMLQRFSQPVVSEEDIADMSLFSLNPRQHVKVYHVRGDVDVMKEIELKPPFEVVYRNPSDEVSALVMVTREILKPRWTKLDQFVSVDYELLIIYYDKPTKLLFINSSRALDSLYQDIVRQIAPTAYPLATNEIMKALLGLKNQVFFNVGLRNRVQTPNTESYRIKAGPNAGAFEPSEGRMFSLGHVFCTAVEDAKKVTIGFSGSSKIWSTASAQIPRLIKWCSNVATKIKSDGKVQTNSGIDYVTTGERVERLPDGIIAADWDKDAYDYMNPIEAAYSLRSGQSATCHISELDVRIDRSQSDGSKVRVIVGNDHVQCTFDFTLDRSSYFEAVDCIGNEIMLRKGEEAQISLLDYLNVNLLHFFTADLALLRGHELFKPPSDRTIFDLTNMLPMSWEGTDIQNETGTTGSVHSFMRNILLTGGYQIVFYDHGTGEVADFVGIKKTDNEVQIELYHCKAAGGTSPGNRVDDLYEVCGQTVKSVAFANPKKLNSKMLIRGKQSQKFLKGTMDDFKKLIEEAKDMRTTFEIVIVQPGITKGNLGERMAEILAATSDYVIQGGCQKLKVISSN